ncbi:hypothetical protein Ct61P_15054 [Colletotrichum tofieldiae]|nr:hypothetical protein Ct61P_15054 [Colletotrichum tofieldiae]
MTAVTGDNGRRDAVAVVEEDENDENAFLEAREERQEQPRRRPNSLVEAEALAGWLGVKSLVRLRDGSLAYLIHDMGPAAVKMIGACDAADAQRARLEMLARTGGDRGWEEPSATGSVADSRDAAATTMVRVSRTRLTPDLAAEAVALCAEAASSVLVGRRMKMEAVYDKRTWTCDAERLPSRAR